MTMKTSFSAMADASSWQLALPARSDRPPGFLDLAGVRGSHIAEPSDPSDQDLSHQAASGHDLGVGELIADFSPVANGFHQADATQRGEMLRDRWLAIAEMLGDLPDLDRSRFAEEMDQLEAARAGHCLEERGLEPVDTVGGSQHGSALACGHG
jgi:hypothetical protein